MPHFPKPWFRKSRKTWFVTLDGQQYNLGPDKAQAKAEYHRLLGELGKANPSKALEMSSLVEQFLAWARRETSEDTSSEYERYTKDFLSRLASDARVEDMRGDHVEAWLGQHPSWGPSSRRKALQVIARLFNWGVGRKLFPVNPVGRLEKPDEQVREHFMSKEEYLFFRKAWAKLPHHLDVLDFLWWTGARPQEAYAFEARHFDARARTLSLERKKAKGRKYVRVVYLDEDAFSLVQRRITTCPYPDSPVFTNSRGVRWLAGALAQAFERVTQKLAIEEAKAKGLEPKPEALRTLLDEERKKGGRKARARAEARAWAEVAAPFVKPIVPYSVRHGFAVRLLTANVDPLTVARLMGHTSTAMIFRTYGHYIQAHDRMHAALEKAKG